MSADAVFLLFLVAGIAGMFAAGRLGDWWDLRKPLTSPETDAARARLHADAERAAELRKAAGE